MVRLASLMTGIDDAPADGHRVRLTADEALVNLRIVLDLCAAGKLRCSDKTGRPSAATSKALASQLVHGDFYPDEPIASFAWPLILQAGGLAKVENGELLLTAKGRSALRQPPHQVIRGLWQRWLSHALLDEFRRIEVIKGQQAVNVLTAARPRREAVSRTLAGLSGPRVDQRRGVVLADAPPWPQPDHGPQRTGDLEALSGGRAVRQLRLRRGL